MGARGTVGTLEGCGTAARFSFRSTGSSAWSSPGKVCSTLPIVEAYEATRDVSSLSDNSPTRLDKCANRSSSIAYSSSSHCKVRVFAKPASITVALSNAKAPRRPNRLLNQGFKLVGACVAPSLCLKNCAHDSLAAALVNQPVSEFGLWESRELDVALRSRSVLRRRG